MRRYNLAQEEVDRCSVFVTENQKVWRVAGAAVLRGTASCQNCAQTFVPVFLIDWHHLSKHWVERLMKTLYRAVRWRFQRKSYDLVNFHSTAELLEQVRHEFWTLVWQDTVCCSVSGEKLSISVLAITGAVWLRSGNASAHLLNKSMTVKMYSFPRLDFGCLPVMSIATTSKLSLSRCLSSVVLRARTALFEFCSDVVGPSCPFLCLSTEIS